MQLRKLKRDSETLIKCVYIRQTGGAEVGFRVSLGLQTSPHLTVWSLHPQSLFGLCIQSLIQSPRNTTYSDTKVNPLRKRRAESHFNYKREAILGAPGAPEFCTTDLTGIYTAHAEHISER